MANRDVFNQFKIVEEHEMGPITVFKMIDPKRDYIDFGLRYFDRFVYGISAPLGMVRKDPELQFEMHYLRLTDGTDVDIENDDLSTVLEDEDDLICHLFLRGTEKGVDATVAIAKEDLSRYAV